MSITSYTVSVDHSALGIPEEVGHCNYSLIEDASGCCLWILFKDEIEEAELVIYSVDNMVNEMEVFVSIVVLRPWAWQKDRKK